MKKKALPKIDIQAYEGIEDLPIYNWNKVIETSDLKYLIVGKIKLGKNILEFLNKRWEKIYDEYIARFGFSEKFIELLELQMETALLKIEKVETEEQFIQTQININEARINYLKKKQLENTGMNFYELKSVLEKQKGFRIDPKSTTVIEFYTDVETLKKAAA